MKKIRFYCAIAALPFILGCSTPAELMSHPITQSFSSHKEAKTVATCVIDGFEDFFKIAGVNGRPTDYGYMVSVSMAAGAGKDTAAVVDIKNTPSGSTSNFYTKMIRGDEKTIKVIENCQ